MTNSKLPLYFSHDTPTTEFHTLSLHDALPISARGAPRGRGRAVLESRARDQEPARLDPLVRSEEHTSELQSHSDLVCRLLLEKKKRESCVHSAEGRAADVTVVLQLASRAGLAR